MGSVDVGGVGDLAVAVGLPARTGIPASVGVAVDLVEPAERVLARETEVSLWIRAGEV